MTLFARGDCLRIEFDETWAWGWLDLPIPRWFQRLMRLKTTVDNYQSGRD